MLLLSYLSYLSYLGGQESFEIGQEDYVVKLGFQNIMLRSKFWAKELNAFAVLPVLPVLFGSKIGQET